MARARVLDPGREGRIDLVLKRAYEAPDREDGTRILVDRLWPRGLTKERAAIDHWARDVAPSDDLRRRFRHDPSQWDEFRTLYFQELDAKPDAVRELVESIGDRATLVYAARNETLNNAVALREYLEDRLPA